MHALLRRLSLALLATCALAAPALAQGGEDEYDFSEIPVEEEEIPYIGVGGGYQLQMTLVNFDELNALAGRLGFGEDPFSGGLFMHGGGGWTAIGIVPNVRLGVFGAGGSKEVEGSDTLGGAHKTSLEISNGITAALVDYAITVAPRFTIAPGIMIGGGSTTIEYTRTSAGATYGGFFDPTTLAGGSATGNRQASMTRSYVHFAPLLNLEYALTQFILLRAGGGYSLSFGDTWSDRHGSDIADVPTDLNANGPTFQVGLFVGLFQQ